MEDTNTTTTSEISQNPLWEAGVKPMELCERWTKNYPAARIAEVVAASKSARNPPAWIRRALEQCWDVTPPKPSIRRAPVNTDMQSRSQTLWERLSTEERSEGLERLKVRYRGNGAMLGAIDDARNGGQPRFWIIDEIVRAARGN